MKIKLLSSLLLSLLGLVSVVALTACSSSSTPTTSIPPTGSSTAPATSTAPASGQPVTINLIAQNIAFDQSTITVPAGAQVTINFTNKDTGIPHNFAVYTNSSASTVIFKGDVITGPASKTYTFTAPTAPGTYFFRCDIHPTQMTGSFIVK